MSVMRRWQRRGTKLEEGRLTTEQGRSALIKLTAASDFT